MLGVNFLAMRERFIFNKSRFKEAQWSYHLHIFLVLDDLPKICKRIYKRNNKGPSIVPWGIQQVSIFACDCLSMESAIRKHFL